MQRVTEICKAAGGDSVAWHVLHANETAIRFYERSGASAVDKVRLMRLEV